MQGLSALTCRQVNQVMAPAELTNAGAFGSNSPTGKSFQFPKQAVGWADNVCLIHFGQRESGNGVLVNKKDC